MPEITVLGVVVREGALLLVRMPGVEEWTLPGGQLADNDDTVEAAMARVWRELSGVAPAAEPEFVDTLYERGPSGVTVHNVFLVASESEIASRGPELELRWTPLPDVMELALPVWLREALPALVAGQQAPEQQIDFGSFDLPGHGGAAGGPPWVFIITGPAGAGKSTVSRALCERFDRCAHIDVDQVRWRFLISGYVPPEGRALPEQREEARRQRALATLNATALARNFVSAGFRAVIDDVLETAAELDDYLGELSGLDVAFVTLLPDAAALRSRDEGRPEEQRMGERAEELRQIIAANGEARGVRLDTSGLSVDETVAAMLERAGEARVVTGSGVWRG